MFNNIGRKIKVLAKISCWLGMLGSVVVAIALFAASSNAYRSEEQTTMIIAGIIVLIGGNLASWIGSFKLYGYGELIEQTTKIAYYTRPVGNSFEKEDAVAIQKKQQALQQKEQALLELLRLGLITQEEFTAKMEAKQ